MNTLKKYIKVYQVVILVLITIVYLGTVMCNSFKAEKKQAIVHPNGKLFAGSATCKNCHRDIFESHQYTAHFLTSVIADVTTIKGNFSEGKNVFRLNDRLTIRMERTPDSLFQVGFVDGKEAMRQPFNIVIGSGRKGQTYLYWYHNNLFQLPVSYYTPLNSWCNSPGYSTTQILFNRNIPGRCLECHGTYFKNTIASDGIEEYDKSKIIYGVDCERCHGPAADHVAWQLNNPQEKKAKYIINPASLSRQLKLDNCALCHSGLRKNSKPSFAFVVGDKLDDFSAPDYNVNNTAKLDVHGNQYGLLTASKCFKMSKMDCSSCHNVHVKETNNAQVFSQRCMSCHNSANHNFCTQPLTKGLVLQNNCIDCHMPALPSNKIFLAVEDKSKSTSDLVRTHLIAIYKEQTKNYLNKINKDKSLAKE
ncbi:MAG: cytochrome c3 family protein [Ginsengibacter sp.]